MSQERQEPDALSRRVFLGSVAATGMAAAGGAAALGATEKSATNNASLQWLNITSERMPQIIKDVKGVCLVPWGCIERHGPHLPVGTDTFEAEALATRASQIEPAVVFPAVYFGQIAEARHCSGTISLDHELLLRLWRALLDEIGRNGFTKIVIVNNHGGNSSLLGYLVMSMLQERKPYVLYSIASVAMSAEDRRKWNEMSPGGDGHAGPSETSIIMHLRPETVHMEDLRDPGDGAPRNHLKNVGVGNSFSWYSNYPTHLGGDPRSATAEKGAFYLEAQAKSLAAQIKRVKEDDVSARLAKEFYDAAEQRPPQAPPYVPER